MTDPEKPKTLQDRLRDDGEMSPYTCMEEAATRLDQLEVAAQAAVNAMGDPNILMSSMDTLAATTSALAQFKELGITPGEGT